MGLSYLLRAAGLAIALIVLAGCGQRMSPVAVFGPSAGAAGHDQSRVLPEAKSEDLLYATTLHGGVDVFSYPGGKLVGTLALAHGRFECADGRGNVYVTAMRGVYEYAHDGSRVKFLKMHDAIACSVDSTTGNLAVVAASSNILRIYPSGSRVPKEYQDAKVSSMSDVAYNSSGKLFIDGAYRDDAFALLQLSTSKGAFDDIKTHGSDIGITPADPIAWDGHYLDIASLQPVYGKRGRQQTVIFRMAIAGDYAVITEKLGFDGEQDYRPQIWLASGTLVEPSNAGRDPHIEVWTYPGEELTKRFSDASQNDFWGVTVSVAPSRGLRALR